MMRKKIVFGVNTSHNMSCAAIIDGEVKVAIEEERLNRVKYCWGYTPYGKIIPYRSINYCCDFLGINAREVDLFVVDSCMPVPNPYESFVEQMIGIDRAKIIKIMEPGHHLAHAYSSFFCSSYQESGILSLDVNGSHMDDGIENFSIYYGNNLEIKLKERELISRGEIGIGELYVLFAALLQLSPESGGGYGNDNTLASGGKLMGYAAYDQRAFAEKITNIQSIWPGDRNKKFTVSLEKIIKYFKTKNLVKHIPTGISVSEYFAWELQRVLQWNYRQTSLSEKQNIELAGEAQGLLEYAIVELARRTYEITKSENLCVAGGTMLNVVACSKILKETPIKNVFVQPAATDAGVAIGAGLYGYYEHFKGKNRFYQYSPYTTLLGKQYGVDEIQKAIDLDYPYSFNYDQMNESAQIELICNMLLDNKIVALFKGRSEFGPRALGSRSFIASPKDRNMLNIMNEIKQREWYRPVAPIVLEEEFNNWFESSLARSPFMTFAASCKENAKINAPAICHVDNSARPQTISPVENPFLHKLLTAFYNESGIPILINTSLNFREPIVETPADAINSFLENGQKISALILEDFVIKKEN